MKDIKTTEEFLKINFGITFSESESSFHNEIANDWKNSMQSYAEYYHKAKVESISDEQIEKYSESVDRLCSYTLGIIKGAKWFKNKLLNDL